jgi:hypothetical protein
MDPEEIKRRMDEMDAQLRVELAKVGFKPDEIERQLDRSIPDDVKKAEREKILARHFVEQVNDPRTGLMDKIVDQAITEAEKDFPGIRDEMNQAEKRAQRKKLLITAGIGLVLAGVAVWYFALRDTRSDCMKAVGPIDVLEKLTGTKVGKPYDYDGKYHCSYTVNQASGNQLATIEIHSDDYGFEKSYLDNDKFTDKQPLQTAAGEATLYVAGDMTKVSTDQLTADIYSRVGKSRDPTGDALAALPPSSHVVLIKRGRGAVKISMNHELFTVEKAIEYAKQVATRLK